MLNSLKEILDTETHGSKYWKRRLNSNMGETEYRVVCGAG